MIHRDIKPGNILIGDDLNIKLGDFGVSGQLSANETSRSTMTGTPYYIAPEILDESVTGYREGVDIWSLGITAIELADGAPPLSDMEPMRVLQVIANKPPPTLEEPSRWSPEFNDFLKQSLVKDPLERPSAAELLKHPFITRTKTSNSLRQLIKDATAIFKEGGGIEKAVNQLIPPEEGADMTTLPTGFQRAPPTAERQPKQHNTSTPSIQVEPAPPTSKPEQGKAGEGKKPAGPASSLKAAQGNPQRVNSTEIPSSPLLTKKEQKKAERERKKQDKLAEKERKKREKQAAKGKKGKSNEPTEEEILSILYQS